MPAEYIRQTHVPSEEAMREWFRTAQAEATTEGMTWFRFSVHPQHSGLEAAIIEAVQTGGRR